MCIIFPGENGVLVSALDSPHLNKAKYHFAPLPCNLSGGPLWAKLTGSVSYGRDRSEGGPVGWKRASGRRRGGWQTDGWIMCWGSPRRHCCLAVSLNTLITSPPSISSVTSNTLLSALIFSLLHFSSLAFSYCTWERAGHLALLCFFYKTMPPTPLSLSVMDATNVHHQQHPSVGDPFLHLLTERHKKPADVIYSFISPIYGSIKIICTSFIHPFTCNIFKLN